MKYVDREGTRYENETSQDRILEFLYTYPIGRLMMKPLVSSSFSKLAGKVLDTKPSTCLIKPFISHADIDMSDYEDTSYTSFNDFFTRHVKEGFRPIQGDRQTLISPCDGKVTIYPISDDTTFSVKKTEYTLRTLLQSKRLAERYNGGYAIILRLTVDDYHRYAYPVNGSKSKNYFIPGALHTVNPVANDYTPIYKENSREYTVLHTREFGDIIQMEVGALMVGKITNHHEEANFVRGEEKGYFEYGGSTIILLVKKNRLSLRPDLIQNTEDGYETKVQLGDSLGTTV